MLDEQRAKDIDCLICIYIHDYENAVRALFVCSGGPSMSMAGRLSFVFDSVFHSHNRNGTD